MRGNRRFAAAVIASLALHGWLLWRYSPIPPPAPEPIVLDLLIAVETRPEPAPSADPPAQKEPETPAVEPLVFPEIPPEITESSPLEEPDDEASEVRAAEPTPRTRLNLQRPADWDEIVSSVPAAQVRLPFNAALSEGVAAREADKRRVSLVGARSAAVYGVADDAFDREGGLGQELKRDGQCYVLISDPSVEEGNRWWPSQCKDTKIQALRLDPVEYDAVGRVIAR